MKIQSICQFMETFAPRRLAEDWDNVGLIAGDRNADARRIMTCLTVTPETADEAIARNVDLIISHHPLPFRPIKRLTTDTTPSELLWKLARASISIYSPHTSFDSAAEGINHSICQKLGLENPKPLCPIKDDPDGLGAGRVGKFSHPLSLETLAKTAAEKFGLPGLHVVGATDQIIKKAAVACGSGGSFLDKATFAGCDALITGEATFHTCLEAKANSVALILLGHYASERFAVEDLAIGLQNEFPDLEIWASADEVDPLAWMAV